MVEELEIVTIIDHEISQDLSQRKVSVGQAVKAMILCGLGFTNHRLYLASHFFNNKPTEQLIGAGIKAEHLNDDVLGRALDKLYEYGVTAMFHRLSQRACEVLDIQSRHYHSDSTTFHVDGAYNSDEGGLAAGVIQVTKGYSRDRRPDLNQFALNLIAENEAGLPMSLLLGNGNQSDSKALPQLIRQYLKQLQNDEETPLFVADAAWYSEENVQSAHQEDFFFVSRVPAKLKLVKSALAETDVTTMAPLKEGYCGRSLRQRYGDVPQRWLLVHSQAAKQRARKTVARRLRKRSEKEVKQWQQLCRHSFACAQDAQQAALQFQKKCRYCRLSQWHIISHAHYAQAGRPQKGTLPDTFTYTIDGGIYLPLALYDELLNQEALFMLATNQLDESQLSDLEILETYQGQVKVERGFRFLKDPLFLINTIFLKKEERVMAVMMVMTACLLVYAALEHRICIRQTLQEHHVTIPDQKGKPTATPTTRWVFQLFLDVSLLQITHANSPPHILCLNLRPELQRLLRLLGSSYASIYYLTPS